MDLQKDRCGLVTPLHTVGTYVYHCRDQDANAATRAHASSPLYQDSGYLVAKGLL